jgi:hypothetical protein
MGNETSTQLDMMASNRSTTPENLAQLVMRKVSKPKLSPRKMPRAAKPSERMPSSQATG